MISRTFTHTNYSNSYIALIKTTNFKRIGGTHLAPYDPLHLLIRRNWCAGQVRVGVADTLGAGQVQAAWAGCCSR